MGFFSKTCEHGIRSVIYLAVNTCDSKKAVLRDIASAIDSPEAFTAKILQELTKSNLISSVKGPFGGFYITNDQLDLVNLKQVVEALDGEEIFIQCALGLKVCSHDKPCPLHDEFLSIRGELQATLTKTTLRMLKKSDFNQETYLKFS
jgi:Rrf2 family protein